ncbi:hypothetical protein DL93DRAFT_2059297 [Clavulina sp. PMI_390]|nr:hypothetical protein DL93DRAFT_2059297 [Clavulina sp. PMI_390]
MGSGSTSGGARLGPWLGSGGAGIAVGGRKPTPEANIVDLERIEKGLDTRTTVMLKNVPNKMTAQDLQKFIQNVVPNSLDFLYLRIDFANHCNVGYAFVNFIDTADLLKFCQACLGKKWNLFQSEKVLQMCYATYQGKDALVDKFRNSAVMKERIEWRPQIFYSSGPQRGMPERFPEANSAIRRERSEMLKSTGMYIGTPMSHMG